MYLNQPLVLINLILFVIKTFSILSSSVSNILILDHLDLTQLTSSNEILNFKTHDFEFLFDNNFGLLFGNNLCECTKLLK